MNNYFKFGLVAALLCSAGYLRAEEVKERVIEEVSVSIKDQIELSTIMAYETSIACTLYDDEDDIFKPDVFMSGYDFYMEHQDENALREACSAYNETEREIFFRGACTASALILMILEDTPSFIEKDAFRAGLINAFNRVPLPKISKHLSNHEVTRDYYHILKMSIGK